MVFVTFYDEPSFYRRIKFVQSLIGSEEILLNCKREWSQKEKKTILTLVKHVYYFKIGSEIL